MCANVIDSRNVRRSAIKHELEEEKDCSENQKGGGIVMFDLSSIKRANEGESVRRPTKSGNMKIKMCS